MSKPKKQGSGAELQRIEDALLDGLLDVPGHELREELIDSGIDPDSYIAEVDSTIAAVRSKWSRKRLGDARAELADWRQRRAVADATPPDSLRAKLTQVRSGDQASDRRILLAARKGKGLSDSDLEGLLEDLAALDDLGEQDPSE